MYVCMYAVKTYRGKVHNSTLHKINTHERIKITFGEVDCDWEVCSKPNLVKIGSVGFLGI